MPSEQDRSGRTLSTVIYAVMDQDIMTLGQQIIWKLATLTVHYWQHTDLVIAVVAIDHYLPRSY